MHSKPMHRCKVSVTDTCSLEKIAYNLMIKGSVILGAGIGLYIAIKMLAKN
jgi:hypothetical protein